MKIGYLHPAAMRRKCLPEPAGTLRFPTLDRAMTWVLIAVRYS